MVLVTDDWEAFKEEAKMFIERAHVFYQVEQGKNTTLVRIVVGRIGFEGEFENDDPRLKEILDWLKAAGGFRVKRSVPEDLFFSSAPLYP